jgi:hypothetical protein
MIDFKKSFLFVLRWQVFAIGLVYIIFNNLILPRLFNIIGFVQSSSQTELIQNYFLVNTLPEFVRLFVTSFVASLVIILALDYWKNDSLNVKELFYNSKKYYLKLLLYYGIYFIIFLIGLIQSLAFLLNIQFLNVSFIFIVLNYLLNFIFIFTPFIIVTAGTGISEGLKRSFSLVKGNLKYTIFVYAITLLVSLISLSPPIIVANLTLSMGRAIVLPLWTEIPFSILYSICFLFNVSFVMGYYLKLPRKK